MPLDGSNLKPESDLLAFAGDIGLANDAVAAAVRRWLETAVIGLNLCPFAKAVHVKRQIRYVVCRATTEEDLLAVLEGELKLLAQSDAETLDTSLLIVPCLFGGGGKKADRERGGLDTGFSAFVAFLDFVAVVIAVQGYSGVLQVASFHPHYVFADADPDDIENCTNRAPFPILHLLRETSLDRATQAFPDWTSIVERNLTTMRSLGSDGWNELTRSFGETSDGEREKNSPDA